MKTLNNEKDLLELIATYCEGFQGRKPLMFWFHSNPDLDAVKAKINSDLSYVTIMGHPLKQGNKYMLLNGKEVKIADHPEVFEEFVLPTDRDNVKAFVYHRYLMQLDKEQLQYCLDIVNIGKYPVICLMNDYSIQDEKPSEELMSFINEHFDQYELVMKMKENN